MKWSWYVKMLLTNVALERCKVENRALEHQLAEANSLSGALKRERDALYQQVHPQA